MKNGGVSWERNQQHFQKTYLNVIYGILQNKVIVYDFCFTNGEKYGMKQFKKWLGQIEQWNLIFYNMNSVTKCSLGNFFKVHSNWEMKSHCKKHIWGTSSSPQSHRDLIINTSYLLGPISIVLVGLLILF